MSKKKKKEKPVKNACGNDGGEQKNGKSQTRVGDKGVGVGARRAARFVAEETALGYVRWWSIPASGPVYLFPIHRAVLAVELEVVRHHFESVRKVKEIQSIVPNENALYQDTSTTLYAICMQYARLAQLTSRQFLQQWHQLNRRQRERPNGTERMSAYSLAGDGVEIEDAVIGVAIAVVVDSHVSRDTDEISVPHAPGNGHAVANVATLRQSLVQRHA